MGKLPSVKRQAIVTVFLLPRYQISKCMIHVPVLSEASFQQYIRHLDATVGEYGCEGRVMQRLRICLAQFGPAKLHSAIFKIQQQLIGKSWQYLHTQRVKM